MQRRKFVLVASAAFRHFCRIQKIFFHPKAGAEKMRNSLGKSTLSFHEKAKIKRPEKTQIRSNQQKIA